MNALRRTTASRLTVLILVALTCPGAGAAATSQRPVAAAELLQAARAAKPDGKLDTILHRSLTEGSSLAVERVRAATGVKGPHRLKVAILCAASDTAALEATVAELGGRVLSSVAGLIEADVDRSQLAQLAADVRVTAVRALVGPLAALQPSPTGDPRVAASTESALADRRFGAPGDLDGSGVRVGIIDVGFHGYSALAGGLLPAPAAVRCYVDFGEPADRLEVCDDPPHLFLGSRPSHGTAVAESLLGVAPGVEVYLANPPSQLDLRQTVEWMVEQGVDIINYSMYQVYSGPGDGTAPDPGSVYETIDWATSRGVVWVGAAGNLAQRHWRGAFSDTNGDGLHEFAASATTNCVYVAQPSVIVASLRWDDSWSAASSDLDLALLHDGEPAWISANRQDGTPGGAPLESLTYLADESGDHCFAVTLAGGPQPRWVELASYTHDLSIPTAEASIAPPADAASPGALAIGATPWFEPTTIEHFSSWGPTADGRLKPDLVSVDRHEAESLGGQQFAGTSQAAPHVSGLVALLRQQLPSLEAASVADLLAASALLHAGADALAWGNGLAWFPEAEPDDREPVIAAGCADALCLGDGRFAIAVQWADRDGHSGRGVPRRLTADSGVFTFFDAGNVELLVKVLDGCAVNDRYWVYAAGLTDQTVDLLVVDRWTGGQRSYHHAGGRPFVTIRDAFALDACRAGAAAASAATATTPGGELSASGWSEVVEVGGGFQVSVRWTASDGSRAALGQPISADSAVFTFFGRDNLELVVKLLDGRSINGAWWVFAAGPTDVGVAIRVEDTRTGSVRTWTRPPGLPFEPVTDVTAFPS